MGWLLFTGIVFILIGAGTLNWWLKKKRLEELKMMAVQLGLSYSAADFEGLLGWPFPLMSKGDGRGIENVLAGQWQGLDIREFDYWYYEESSDSNGNRNKTYYRFSCAMVTFAAYCPQLSVTRENALTRLKDVIGFPDIQLELEAFNRAFLVRSDNRKFAFDFLDARMMQHLLDADSSFSFEVASGGLLVFCKRVAPRSLIPVLGTVRAFHDAVPRVVYELYGAGGETKPGQIM